MIIFQMTCATFYENFSNLFTMIIIFGFLLIIQIMMIVKGATYPDVICKSPCISYECDNPKNAEYKLPTPPIGISASVWLIVGGAIGIVFIPLFLKTYKSNPREMTFPSFVILLILFMGAVGWLILGPIVYTQTRKLCTDHNGMWFIETPTMQWLLGTLIGGFVVLLSPFTFWVLTSLFCGCKKGAFSGETQV